MAGGVQRDDLDLENDIFDLGDDLSPGDASVHANPVNEAPEDDQLVSAAIRDIIHPQPQAHPQPQPQAQPGQPQPGQPQRQDEPPLTPREQALLRDLREERQRRQEIERRVQGGGHNGQQPGHQPQQRPLADQLFENPEEVIGAIQQSFAQQLAQVQLKSDLDLAHIRHGETFVEAFNTFMEEVQNVDRTNPADFERKRRVYERVMTAPSPGEEIIAWHREASLMRETGGDVNAFRERIRQEILAEMQGGGQQPSAQPQPAAAEPPRAPNGQFAPRHEVRVPTATSRLAGGTGNGGNDQNEDGSEDAIFDAGRAPR